LIRAANYGRWCRWCRWWLQSDPCSTDMTPVSTWTTTPPVLKQPERNLATPSPSETQH